MTKNTKEYENEWMLADDDSQQYVRRTSKFEFDLIEMCLIRHNPDRYAVYSTDIDVSEWFADENRNKLENIISTFGYDDIDEMKQNYGEEYLQVIAECIFEYYGSVMADTLFEGPEKDCIAYIRNYVGI